MKSSEGEDPRQLKENVRSDLFGTRQVKTKRQDAICLRTVRGVAVNYAVFQVVMEVITSEHRRALE